MISNLAMHESASELYANGRYFEAVSSRGEQSDEE